MRRPVDTPFLLVVCALVVFGLLIFTSAALSLLSRGGATFTSVAVSQLLLGFICGGIALFVLSRIDYRLWRPYTVYFFALSFALTLLTFLPGLGLSLKGASRWLAIGPLSFQPEELLKFSAVMLLAALWSNNLRGTHTLRGGLVPLAVVGGLSVAILLAQPDTAGAMILAAAAAAMLFVAGGSLKHMVSIVLIGVVLVAGAAAFYPHVRDRIATFVSRSDPQGSGYQVEQSLIAVGSGQLTGRGFGQSIEKFSYLPEPIGDSIFAVAAEEWGFLGSSVLVLLYGALCVLGLRIAARAGDPFGGLIAAGLVVIIVGQSLFNIASILGLVPLVGVPLIFVSHGGTALAISLAEVGVILSVSRRMRHA
ncbi:MAG: FtsW/RodA/SpoVE family cell cycle protein [Patescibacteria group bacterium]|nr:FtsW/RodA/SpoVE family cell cycle protein [Patescibacteria group bacterium]